MKLKTSLSFVIIILVSSCHSKIYREINNISKSNKNFLFEYYSRYSDSINMICKGQPLPKFLLDPEFDFHHNGGWSASHSPLPLRRIIIEEVKSCNSLKILLDMDLPILKIKPHPEDSIKIKYEEYSFYELILSRYSSMKCSSLP